MSLPTHRIFGSPALVLHHLGDSLEKKGWREGVERSCACIYTVCFSPEGWEETPSRRPSFPSLPPKEEDIDTSETETKS